LSVLHFLDVSIEWSSFFRGIIWSSRAHLIWCFKLGRFGVNISRENLGQAV
jgi:hypothetical protein